MDQLGNERTLVSGEAGLHFEINQSIHVRSTILALNFRFLLNSQHSRYYPWVVTVCSSKAQFDIVYEISSPTWGQFEQLCVVYLRVLLASFMFHDAGRQDNAIL